MQCNRLVILEYTAASACISDSGSHWLAWRKSAQTQNGAHAEVEYILFGNATHITYAEYSITNIIWHKINNLSSDFFELVRPDNVPQSLNMFKNANLNCRNGCACMYVQMRFLHDMYRASSPNYRGSGAACVDLEGLFLLVSSVRSSVSVALHFPLRSLSLSLSFARSLSLHMHINSSIFF